MKNTRKGFLIPLIILIIAVIILGAIYAVSVGKKNSWKTYTDSMFKVELMMPESWTSISGRNDVGTVFFQLNDPSKKNNITFAFKGEARCIPTTEVTISGEKAYDVGWRTDPKSGQVRIICLANRPYSIRLVAIDEQTKMLEDKIIDSIKFASSTDQSTQNLTKTYVEQTFGFSFSYPDSSVITTDKDGNINITSSTSPFIIKKTTDTGRDSNGKFGEVKIAFTNNQWTIQLSNQNSGGLSSPIPVSADSMTDSGLPVFSGATRGHGWGRYSYIIALSHTKFLTIEGPDNTTDGQYSEATDPTLKIVKTIRAF